jgi:hypothetical protein
MEWSVSADEGDARIRHFGGSWRTFEFNGNGALTAAEYRDWSWDAGITARSSGRQGSARSPKSVV